MHRGNPDGGARGAQAAFAALAEKYQFKKSFRLVAGGAERQESVWNGLAALSPGTELVVIQDAARPCTSQALIAATIEADREVGAAVAAQPVTDTIKESGDGRMIERTLDRSRLWAVQPRRRFAWTHPARAVGGAAARVAGDRQHGGVRTHRAAGPARGEPAAESQNHLPGGPALGRELAATQAGWAAQVNRRCRVPLRLGIWPAFVIQPSGFSPAI